MHEPFDTVAQTSLYYRSRALDIDLIYVIPIFHRPDADPCRAMDHIIATAGGAIQPGGFRNIAEDAFNSGRAVFIGSFARPVMSLHQVAAIAKLTHEPSAELPAGSGYQDFFVHAESLNKSQEGDKLYISERAECYWPLRLTSRQFASICRDRHCRVQMPQWPS